jgi:hypothetical protein
MKSVSEGKTAAKEKLTGFFDLPEATKEGHQLAWLLEEE